MLGAANIGVAFALFELRQAATLAKVALKSYAPPASCTATAANRVMPPEETPGFFRDQPCGDVGFAETPPAGFEAGVCGVGHSSTNNTRTGRRFFALILWPKRVPSA